jgi:hypothetical protein
MTNIPPRSQRKEHEFMALLKELQAILAEALDSLGGKTPPTSGSSYLGRIAITVNRVSDAYICLRDLGRADASKLLIRPVLEATFLAAAAMKDPNFLFRRAYTEWEEDRKLFARDDNGRLEADCFLEELKSQFRKQCPEYPVRCERLSMRQAAEMADLLPQYEGTYRIYCKFTHSALRAVSGNLNEMTDSNDTHTVVWCALMTLGLLQKHTPAIIPSLDSFVPRLRSLNELE